MLPLPQLPFRQLSSLKMMSHSASSYLLLNLSSEVWQLTGGVSFLSTLAHGTKLYLGCGTTGNTGDPMALIQLMKFHAEWGNLRYEAMPPSFH